MTNLETTLIVILWFIIGMLICKKRNWYKYYDGNDVACVVAVIFAPANLIITLVRVYIIDEWDDI